MSPLAVGLRILELGCLVVDHLDEPLKIGYLDLPSRGMSNT